MDMGNPRASLASLINQGVTIQNLMGLEFTYLHWHQQLEHVPMNVPLEDVLNPLYEVELRPPTSDFPDDITPAQRESFTEILTASLKSIKSFMSSFGILTADFFAQDKTMGRSVGDKSGKQGKGKPKGGIPEEQVTKGGKSLGKKGSTNKPKEPTLPLANHKNWLLLRSQNSLRLRAN